MKFVQSLELNRVLDEFEEWLASMEWKHGNYIHFVPKDCVSASLVPCRLWIFMSTSKKTWLLRKVDSIKVNALKFG
jgi:hypothetical protein